MIFYELDQKSLQAASSVCRYWSGVTVDTARSKEAILINQYIAFIISKLHAEKYPNQIRALEAIQGNQILNFKTSAQRLAENVINLLKEVSPEDLTQLSTSIDAEKTPFFFESTLEIAITYKHFEEARNISPEIVFNRDHNRRIREDAFRVVYDSFLRLNYLPGLLESTRYLPNGDTLLKGLVQEMIKKGNYINALASVNYMNWLRANTLNDLAKELIEVGEVDLAIKAGQALQNLRQPPSLHSSERADALSRIVTRLADRCDFDRAIEVAELIDHPQGPLFYTKSYTLVYLAEILVQKREFDRASMIVNSIHFDNPTHEPINLEVQADLKYRKG